MTRVWTVVQHVPWEGPGLIAAEAKARGYGTDIRRMDLGVSLPEPDEVAGLVVMGGPMGAYETDQHSFLAAECHLMAEMARRGRPVLGVCLGAQLLAQALGAKVFPGHRPEIGFGTVQLTAAGREDPIFAPVGTSLPAFHWHGDTFDLPQGAALLASSAEYPHQAFRFGKCVYGLQFHVEPGTDTWRAWKEHLPSALDCPPQKRDELERVGKGVIARFFALASEPPSGQ